MLFNALTAGEVSAAAAALASLDARERDILRHVIIGYAVEDSARGLGLGVRTVRQYRRIVLRKLRAQNFVAAIRLVAVSQRQNSAAGQAHAI